MRKSLVKLLGLAIALALSGNVFAVGLGGINVSSGLGQQLRADIELVAVTKTEKASLVARLASPEAYKDAGIEYPYGNKFKFQIESRANGEPYLKVSSDQPINDPFVIMLVEVSWSAGKLLREYTFLLDPPGYVPSQPAQAAAQAVPPVVQSAPASVPAIPGGEAAPAPAPSEQAAQVTPIAPMAEPLSSEIAAASAPAEQAASAPETRVATPSAEPLPELDEWIVVKRGDTMREIADQHRLADLSLDRMLVALYRVNIDRFDGKNMNRIKAGKVVRLPHQNEVEAVGQSEAVREIRAQAADWNIYRQKLASAAAIRRQSQEAQQIATGRITSSVADKTPVAKETAKEVLKLSKGEAPGDRAATGAGGKLDAAQEDTIAMRKRLQDEQARVAMLEKNLADLRRLAEARSSLPQVKTEAAALAQNTRPVAPAAASSAVGATQPVAAASAVAAKADKPKAKAAPRVVEPEPLLDKILAEPLYLGAGVLLLIALGGVGFVLMRRKKKPYDEALDESSEEAGAVDDERTRTGRLAAPIVPSPDTGDFTRMGVAEEATTPASESHIDPIGEADLFLNFGRDAQAEEILKEALQTTPNDHRIHLKLLSIYANRVDAGSFEGIARQLKDSGDEESWQQAYAMGRKLDPSNTLYGGSGQLESTGSATAAFNATQLFEAEGAPPAPALDLEFDLGTSAAQGAVPPEQNFLSDETAQVETMSFDVMAAAPAEIDLNVAAEPGGSGAATADTGDLIFDVGSGFAPAPAEQPEAAKPSMAEEGGMEFTLDFPIEKSAGEFAPEPQPAGIGLEGISLNFDEPLAPATPAAGGKDEQWQEVATKLDLAKAYQEMGDASGAREILAEVLRDGDEAQREAAQALISQLG